MLSPGLRLVALADVGTDVSLSPYESAWGITLGGVRRLMQRGEPGLAEIRPNIAFAIAGAARFTGYGGFAVIKLGYKVMNTAVGPLESMGRLRYIDGCSDTLLIGPHRKGEPCLNHLHFPAGIHQTLHTHPSERIGMITAGQGKAFNGDLQKDVPLLAGNVFYMLPGTVHAFSTRETRGMDVVAWHPDSDMGPTDTDHPMLNRTIVNGQSAAAMPDIQTQSIAE